MSDGFNIHQTFTWFNACDFNQKSFLRQGYFYLQNQKKISTLLATVTWLQLILLKVQRADLMCDVTSIRLRWFESWPIIQILPEPELVTWQTRFFLYKITTLSVDWSHFPVLYNYFFCQSTTDELLIYLTGLFESPKIWGGGASIDNLVMICHLPRLILSIL